MTGFILTGVLGAVLTHQIERAALEHRIRFSQLHQDRGAAIKTIYQMIVEVELEAPQYGDASDSIGRRET